MDPQTSVYQAITSPTLPYTHPSTPTHPNTTATPITPYVTPLITPFLTLSPNHPGPLQNTGYPSYSRIVTKTGTSVPTFPSNPPFAFPSPTIPSNLRKNTLFSASSGSFHSRYHQLDIPVRGSCLDIIRSQNLMRRIRRDDDDVGLGREARGGTVADGDEGAALDDLEVFGVGFVPVGPVPGLEVPGRRGGRRRRRGLGRERWEGGRRR
ncbi:hypothetical protein QBC34DRAFT_386447 [Podospora aff. communis PSN243]|uniref:Uncharacterized protein n=1 Tax=Podospora aff. communis PSN243 TaxID=3040156 RepID=A0AAV9G779_9PEZI|nr:hypothetical protein QBC34DRAFT_386447 [Podospora aff. communis PSN243]